MKKIIVNKFGGAVMGSPIFISLALKHIADEIKKGFLPIVVVSALRGITDKLESVSNTYNPNIIEDILHQHEELLNHFSIKDSHFIETILKDIEKESKSASCKNNSACRDKILGAGERMAAPIFAKLLEQKGIKSVYLSGEEIGIVTDDTYGDAKIDYEESAKNIKKSLQSILKKKTVPVITGFIGRTKIGNTTTLGRGGSDTTACLLGAVLLVERVILWKEVDGVLSGDPHIVSGAKNVSHIDYLEAEESGKVIHDKSMRIIRKEGITVEVKNIQNTKEKTLVTYIGSSKKGVKIVNSKAGLKLITIIGEKIKRSGALFQISRIFATEGINMVLIRNTRDSLYIVVEKNGHDIESAIHKIIELDYEVTHKDVSMVNIIGHLNWHTVEKFNYILHRATPSAELGAFPYKNCVRLEAIVPPNKEVEMVRKLHKVFVEQSH